MLLRSLAVCRHSLKPFLTRYLCEPTEHKFVSRSQARAFSAISADADLVKVAPPKQKRPAKDASANANAAPELGKKTNPTPGGLELPQTESTAKRRHTKDIKPGPAKASTTKTKNAKPVPATARQKKVVAARKPYQHHDLASFVQYNEKNKSSTASNSYRGAHYEYTVAESLNSYNFVLERTGRTNDKGIDLQGEWHLPGHTSGVKVIIQCKLGKNQPAFVRELGGTCEIAPIAFRGHNTMAFLVSAHPPTSGVVAAIRASKRPMAFMRLTPEGIVTQFTWNDAASNAFLTGMEARETHQSGIKEPIISLLWGDKVWRGPMS